MTRKFLAGKTWAALLLGAALVGSAHAQTRSTPAQPRSTLDLKTVNAKVDGLIATNEKNNQDVARAINLLTQIQQEFKSIKGHVEASKVLQKESDRVYQDLDVRVSALEDKINQIHQLMKELRSPAPAAAPTPSVPQTANEYEEFQSLVNLMNAEDFRGAASGMLGFLKKYPQSSMAGSAQYWLAEAYYSMGDFAKAITEFQVLSDKYPQHPRVKEGIYKQGSAFMRLKKYPEAKLFFQKVMATYPNSPEAIQAKARLLRVAELEQVGTPVAASPSSPANPGSSAPSPSTPPPPPVRENVPSNPQEGGAPLF